MVAHLNRFLSSGAGLEKTLRLIQSMSQIAAVFTVGSTAVRFTAAKLQLALTRRFFRFFGFIDSFQRVSALLSNDGMSSVPGWLELAKWTCFGLYFLLEDLTILHAMDVYLVPWEQRVMKEANSFWFYALSFSIAGAIYSLLFSESGETASKSKDSKNEKNEKNGAKAEKEKTEAVADAKSSATKTTALLRQIVVESCDLVLPVTLLGWVHLGDLVVGGTMVVSTILTGREIWKRV